MKLIYFKSCPNYEPLKLLLKELGVEFEEVCQDDLEEGNENRGYSSPTLLYGNQIIFGFRSIGGSCSVVLPNKEELKSKLKSLKSKE